MNTPHHIYKTAYNYLESGRDSSGMVRILLTMQIMVLVKRGLDRLPSRSPQVDYSPDIAHCIRQSNEVSLV
jgi:hypothetical protein